MIVVDVETTGLELEKHQIISIGAVDFADPRETHYDECRLSRGAKVSKNALIIAGFTLAQLKDKRKPLLKEVLREFLRWATTCKERTLAGENICFDVRFLQHASRTYGLTWPFGHRYIDLHSVSYAVWRRAGKGAAVANGVSSLSLDKTLRFVGLKPRKGAHHALNDAKLEAEALSRLMYGKTLLKEFCEYPLPSYLRYP